MTQGKRPAGGDRGPRRRIGRGLYADRYGVTIKVKVAGRTREERAPLTTSLADLERRRREIVVDLEREDDVPTRGALSADALRYYREIRTLASWRERRAEIRAWLRLTLGRVALRKLPRGRLTASHVRQAQQAWVAAGVAPKTVNNRVGALRHLFHVLDGRRRPTPCDEVRPLAVKKTPPQVVPDATILAVDAQLQSFERAGRLRDGKARARFRVAAACGRRPSEIGRAVPTDVDFDRRTWIPRDGKGGFSPGLYLNDDMLAAWRLFAEVDAWGPFREGSWVRTLRAAGWPTGVRPYQLRHTVGITLSEQEADLADVSGWLGHTRVQTTRSHYVPVRGSRIQRMSERMDGRFGWGSGSEPLGVLVARAAAALRAAGFTDRDVQRVLRQTEVAAEGGSRRKA